jgi:hypothetical protein
MAEALERLWSEKGKQHATGRPEATGARHPQRLDFRSASSAAERRTAAGGTFYRPARRDFPGRS